MKINKAKFDLAKARACMGTKDIVKAGVPKGTLCRILSADNVRPETVGKIAKALGVDVTELLEDT